jgi:hypothetical protein
MNHILKMKKIIQWLRVYLCVPWAALLVVLVPQMLLLMFGALISGELIEMLETIGHLILQIQEEQPGILLEMVFLLWLLGFLKNRVLYELDIQQNRVNKRGQYIYRIRQVLKEHDVEAEYPQDAGSPRIWKEAAEENRRLGKRIKLLLIVMWGMAVWQLADLILIGLGNPEIFDEYTGFWILAMIYKVVHIFLTIYIQKQLPSELDLLEMSLREQKKEIEALEQQCSQNNISMDEVWGTAEKYASRRTKAKGT